MRRLNRRKIKGTKRGQGVEAPDFSSMPPPENDPAFDDDGNGDGEAAAVSLGVLAPPPPVRSVSSQSADGLSSEALSPRSVDLADADTCEGHLSRRAGKRRNRVSIDCTQYYTDPDDDSHHSHHILLRPPSYVSDEAGGHEDVFVHKKPRVVSVSSSPRPSGAVLSSDCSMDWSIDDELGQVPNSPPAPTQTREDEGESESLLEPLSGDLWDDDEEFRTLIGRTIHFP